jgi:hypothetical protein
MYKKKDILRKSNKTNKKSGDGFVRDRRSGKDRRKGSNAKYFIKNGVERRSWKERRNLWYMTR